MGKTSFALRIVRNISTTHQDFITVGIFSMEMSKEQLATRLLSSESEIDHSKLRTGTFSGEEWPKVTTAHEPPTDLTGFDKALRSRFASGTAVEISPPDVETRMAILKKWAVLDRLVDMPDDVVFFVASTICSRTGAMIGFLIRLDASVRIRNVPVTLKLAREFKRRLDEIDAKRGL